MNDLVDDIAKLAHDLEWLESGDYDEEKYRKTVLNFKQKWFKSSCEERLKKYVDETLNDVRVELLNMIGIKEEKEATK